MGKKGGFCNKQFMNFSQMPNLLSAGYGGRAWILVAGTLGVTLRHPLPRRPEFPLIFLGMKSGNTSKDMVENSGRSPV